MKKEVSFTLQCGRYPIQVFSTDYLPGHLISRCVPYRKTEPFLEEARISIQNDLKPSSCHYDGNWEFCENDTDRALTYYSSNKGLFSVNYTDNSTDILLRLEDSANYMIALQHAVMIALAKKCIGFHGVTVICKDKAVILSAPSGTGKTTLAKLLQRTCEAAVVNGDFALLSFDPVYGLMFEPTPFCGSSGVCHNVRLPIDQIVFLEQGKTNEFKSLDAHHALRFMMNNTFIPEKDAFLSMYIEEQILHIVETVPISKFAFEPTDEAAHVFYKALIN